MIFFIERIKRQNIEKKLIAKLYDFLKQKFVNQYIKVKSNW